MDLNYNFIYWFLSATPIVLLLTFLMILKLPALKAAPLTLLITTISGIFIFKGNLLLIGVELGKALWSSLSIISVVITAIFLYETSKEADAFSVLNKAFVKIAPNELIRIILIGIVFSSFLQGVTGFGVPILVTAPLLIGIGVLPIYSVIIPLIGHCWAGTFGTLALAWHALLLQTEGLNHESIVLTAFYASVLLGILNLLSGMIISYIYGGLQGVKKGFLAVLLISMTQSIGQVIITQINPDLGVFIPSTLSALVLYTLSRTSLYNKEWRLENSKILLTDEIELEEANSKLKVKEAFLPYLVMTGLTLIILLIPPVNKLFGMISFGPSFPETSSGFGVINNEILIYSPIKPFTHASFLLLLSSLGGYWYYLKIGEIRKNMFGFVLRRTFRKALPSSVAVISLISISRIMTGTGQTQILAVGVSSLFGNYYSLVSPFVGLLGSFITSSNMSSNILFGGFQYASSTVLSIDSHLLLGAQTAGGSIGTSIAPSNIILGATTAGILGKEGEILKKNLPFVLIITLLFGLITFIISNLH